jgi:hypothetical protein
VSEVVISPVAKGLTLIGGASAAGVGLTSAIVLEISIPLMAAVSERAAPG